MWIGGASYRTGTLNVGFTNYFIEKWAEHRLRRDRLSAAVRGGDDGPSVRVGVKTWTSARWARI